MRLPPISTLFPYTTLFRSVPRPAELHADIVGAETAVQKFFREMREGLQFLREHREIAVLGLSWALFLSAMRSEEHTSELQSHSDLVCRLLLEKKKKKKTTN